MMYQKKKIYELCCPVHIRGKNRGGVQRKHLAVPGFLGGVSPAIILLSGLRGGGWRHELELANHSIKNLLRVFVCLCNN